MRTSENSVSANFGEGEFSVSRNELARRHGTGVVNRTVREHEDGPTPPPRSARPPRLRIVSEGPGPVHAPFGPFRPARERRGARKSPAAQEGGIRAAGPDGILLPGRERGRRSSAASAKRTSQTPVEAKFAELLPRTRVNGLFEAPCSVAGGGVEHHHAPHDQGYAEDVHRPQDLLPDQQP